ncbi:pupal cuticle protein 36a-like [Topomyia yanbarensis]|uniref:pupal cuticle protein 36a-like n=1 Tax=Topomyia yanbarensis TaxID=2498891 RepID=UPI00273B11FB|nr:pupal cuticle protein 36a-like [Topomyia yanbarensis]
MISKTILWCALLGSALTARLDNLYGAPAPPGAGRGGGGNSNFLNAPRAEAQYGGAPSNQYLPPTGQASNQGGYPSVAPLGGSQAQSQFGYNPQQGQHHQQPQQPSQQPSQQPQSFGGFGGGQSGSGFGGNQPGGGFGGNQPGGGFGGNQPGGGFGGSQSGGGYGGTQSGGGFGGGQSGSGFQGGFQQSRTTPIPILRYENVNNGDGSYHFDYATGNGIQHKEEGYNRKIGPELGEQIVSGGYSYTGPDGKLYSIQYKADAGGFQPVGDHLPTPPPLPQELQDAYNLHAKLYAEAAARPKNPAYQGPQGYDQQQPGQQYGAPQSQYQSPNQQYGAPQPQPQYQAPQQQFQNTATSVQGYQSAPSNQYLPPTNSQQSFNPNSGYQY